MKKFTLTFSQEQLKVLNDALVEMPFRLSAPLISQINLEIQSQFNDSIDNKDTPTGQTMPKDEFAGD